MQHTEPSAVERSLTMYRRLLRAYPPAFREQYGDEMARAFRDAARVAWLQSGLGGLIALWARTLTDTLVNATHQRMCGSDEGRASSRWGKFVRRMRTQYLPVVAGIAVLLTLLYGIWGMAERLLPLAPAASRGWTVLIGAVILGLPLAKGLGGNERAAWWRRSVSAIGILGWVLWFATYAQLGLAGFWAVILPWVPIMCVWPIRRDRSTAERTGVIVPADHLTFALPALLLVSVAPAPYVATNVFLVFVGIFNLSAALLPPTVSRTHKTNVNAN